MKKNNRVKILIFVIVCIPILFIAYVFTFQYLVNKGFSIADEHCINVNPYIIERKNAYNAQYNIMMASGSAQQFKIALDKYFQASKDYISAEKVWLPKDKALIDSPLFNLILPSYLKDTVRYQYEMYMADYLASVYIDEAFDEKDPAKQLELSRLVIQESKTRDLNQEKYNEISNKNLGASDWIFKFVKIPTSHCPAKNDDIPNTPNLFEPATTPQPGSANPDIPAS